MHLLPEKPPVLLHHPLASPVVGLALGAIAILTTIAPLAVLIFDSALPGHAATGIGIALFSAAVVGLVVAWRSSFENTLALPIPEEMVVMAAIAASVAEAMPPGTGDREMAFSVVVAIALTSILTGSILLLLGQLRFGESIRFLPYPVIGGVFAGLGFLLVMGALRVLLGTPVNFSDFWQLLQLPDLWRWLPSAALAALLMALTRRIPRIVALPVAALGGILAFYIVLFFCQVSVAEAGAGGWLLGPFPSEEVLWRPLELRSLGAANWDILLPQIPQMLSVVAVSTLSLLLVSSGIELVAERDLDLNRELRATGLANILSGLGGGLVGSPSFASVQAYRWGANSRLVGVGAALLYLSVLLFGLRGLAFFPRPVLGALLLYLGLELLWQWLHDTLVRLPLRDYALVLTIAGTIATLGFVPGIVVGFGVAILLFVFDYSQMRVTRASLSGSSYGSRVQRPVNQERLLRERGDAVYILQLQGLIFFGTMHKLLRQLRLRLDDPTLEPLQYVILDFQWVGGLDSSTAIGFAKLRQTLLGSEIVCLLAHLSPAIEGQLRQGGALTESDPQYLCFPDLDRAVEWCENQIIATSKWRRTRTLPVALQLKFLFGEDGKEAPTFVKYLEKRGLETGDRLFCQGDTSKAVYFIENGQISTLSTANGTTDRRVQTLRAGTFVGELEFFTHVPYRLTAIADRSSTVYCLNRAAFTRMRSENPDTALAFSRFLNTLLAERLARAQAEIDRFFI